MLLRNIFEDHNFMAGTQTSSYLDLIMKCLMGSSRALTKYLETPPEQHTSLRRSVTQMLKAQDQDAYGDMRDIVDTLKADGFVNSTNEVRTIGTFFNAVDQAIRSKREQDS